MSTASTPTTTKENSFHLMAFSFFLSHSHKMTHQADDDPFSSSKAPPMAHSAPCNNDAAAAVIFARLPIPGQAKTRLAAGVGAENAAEFYRRMAEGTFSATARCTLLSSRTLFYSEASESDGIARWMARCEGEGEGGGGAGVDGATHGMRMLTASTFMSGRLMTSGRSSRCSRTASTGS